MRSEKEIRERLNQERKEFVRRFDDTYETDTYRWKGFIEALEWVLEENTEEN